jgi:2',3'-cyclic-nucleotide 2'-phosphodiesterase
MVYHDWAAMKILYIGDIMGEAGIKAVKRMLPEFEKKYEPDVVLAQAENVTDGRGMTRADYKRLQALGIDGFMSGNWTMYQTELYDILKSPKDPVTRPANYPAGTPGREWKVLETSEGPVLLVSLLGQIVGRDADRVTDNPLTTIDRILEETKHVKFAAKIVNFHGDYSSEKRVIGYYLDGRVSAVIGDHWHVPTADAMVLPKGTAHLTDVGMCGSLHSSLGVKLDVIVDRWKNQKISRNILETAGPLQFNAAVIDLDTSSGKARSIQVINHILAE